MPIPELAVIFVQKCGTTEPFFKEFEIELHNDATGSNKRAGPFTASGQWNAANGRFEQQGVKYFYSLVRGTTYHIRSRVIPIAGGPPGAWTAFVSEVAGDTTAPAPTYGSATVDLIHKGLIVALNPSGAPSDVHRYELFFNFTGTTPGVDDPPARKSFNLGDPTFLIGEFAGVPVTTHLWARAVDTSGNRQVGHQQ